MKREQILKEILEKNPDLKHKKESINKLIDILIKNNPDIKPDKKFSEGLKQEINSMIKSDEKSLKKLSIFTAFIQFISIAFIFAWVYYSFNNVSFFNNNNINWDLTIKEKQSIIKQEDNTQNQETKIEDTQLIDLFWDYKESNDNIKELTDVPDMPSDRSVETNSVGIQWFSTNNLIEETEKIDNTNKNLKDIKEQKSNFENYCREKYWQILNIEWNNFCIFDKKNCSEEDFYKDNCNFNRNN